MHVPKYLKKPHPPWLQHLVLALVVLLCLFGCDINVDNDYHDAKPITGQDTVSATRHDGDAGTPVPDTVDNPDTVRPGIFRWQK